MTFELITSASIGFMAVCCGILILAVAAYIIRDTFKNQ